MWLSLWFRLLQKYCKGGKVRGILYLVIVSVLEFSAVT